MNKLLYIIDLLGKSKIRYKERHSILELGLSHLYLISLVDLVLEPQQNTPILELNKALIKRYSLTKERGSLPALVGLGGRTGVIPAA